MRQLADDTRSTTDGLWRWLLGGLAAGGVILGLLIAAYAVGYHRGQHDSTRAKTHAFAPTTTATTTAAPPVSGELGPITVTPGLVARGKALYTRDSCSGCHSLNGVAGAGPSFKDLAGSTSTLSNGQTTIADDVYLERSVADPDAQIAKGYTAGLMAPAIASFDLAHKPDDLRALVAFIKSQK